MSRLGDVPALDERLYSLNSDELEFFLAETSIESESALKTHILDLQAKAYKVSLRVTTAAISST